MQSTEFFLNGYRVNGGDIMSFSITNSMALEAIELVIEFRRKGYDC